MTQLRTVYKRKRAAVDASMRVPFREVGPLGKKVSGAISKSDLKGRRRPGFGRKCSSYIRITQSEIKLSV
jgi:hypothetical protein